MNPSSCVFDYCHFGFDCFESNQSISLQSERPSALIESCIKTIKVPKFPFSPRYLSAYRNLCVYVVGVQFL